MNFTKEVRFSTNQQKEINLDSMKVNRLFSFVRNIDTINLILTSQIYKIPQL